ncbi:MAG: hypothetical protein ACREVE_04015 [Gammaproteobacteria bacterium]
MNTYNINTWVDTILALNDRDISSAKPLPSALRIEAEDPLEVYYAPFDYIHRDARLVIVGITPGRTQAVDAILTARRALLEGLSSEEAARQAKRSASFCGPMRANLVEMIDFIGLTKWLGLSAARELFELDSTLLHTTSAFRNPVFYRGVNYNCQVKLRRSSMLQRTAREILGSELAALPKAAIVPLGPAAEEAVLYAMRERHLDTSRVLAGMPHPSGANAERVAYLVGRKCREGLSSKTNAEKLDRAREFLCSAVAAL